MICWIFDYRLAPDRLDFVEPTLRKTIAHPQKYQHYLNVQSVYVSKCHKYIYSLNMYISYQKINGFQRFYSIV